MKIDFNYNECVVSDFDEYAVEGEYYWELPDDIFQIIANIFKSGLRINILINKYDEANYLNKYVSQVIATNLSYVPISEIECREELYGSLGNAIFVSDKTVEYD